MCVARLQPRGLQTILLKPVHPQLIRRRWWRCKPNYKHKAGGDWVERQVGCSPAQKQAILKWGLYLVCLSVPCQVYLCCGSALLIQHNPICVRTQGNIPRAALRMPSIAEASCDLKQWPNFAAAKVNFVCAFVLTLDCFWLRSEGGVEVTSYKLDGDKFELIELWKMIPQTSFMISFWEHEGE